MSRKIVISSTLARFDPFRRLGDTSKCEKLWVLFDFVSLDFFDRPLVFKGDEGTPARQQGCHICYCVADRAISFMHTVACDRLLVDVLELKPALRGEREGCGDLLRGLFNLPAELVAGRGELDLLDGGVLSPG